MFVDFSVYIGAFSKTIRVEVFLLRPAINLPWPGVIYIWGHKIGSVVSTFMGYKQTNKHINIDAERPILYQIITKL